MKNESREYSYNNDGKKNHGNQSSKGRRKGYSNKLNEENNDLKEEFFSFSFLKNQILREFYRMRNQEMYLFIFILLWKIFFYYDRYKYVIASFVCVNDENFIKEGRLVKFEILCLKVGSKRFICFFCKNKQRCWDILKLGSFFFDIMLNFLLSPKFKLLRNDKFNYLTTQF